MASSSALRMFCRPGNLSEICISFSWLYIPFLALSLCHVPSCFCLGGLNEPSV
jgi:hypothetical protein